MLLHSHGDEIVPFEGAKELGDYLQNNTFVEYEKFSHSSPMLLKKHGKKIMADYCNFIKSL